MDYLQSGSRIRLMKPMGKMANVGEIYEIGVIAEKAYIIRDVKTKVAISAVSFDVFDEYFIKVDMGNKRWTNWHGLSDTNGNVFALYRTNGKKVQIKTMDNVKGESSCNTMDDFNLYFGINLAMLRVQKKLGKIMSEKGNDMIANAQSNIKSMIDTFNKSVK